MNAAELLANSLSPDAATRQGAEQKLSAAAQDSYPAYMTTLVSELANESAPSHIRNAAGLAIKNALSAREAQRSDEYARRWFELSEDVRNEIKTKTFNTLGSQDSRAGLASAQVLAAITTVELPRGQSQNLIRQLLEAMGDVNNKNLRRATLQAIGFICESAPARTLESQSDQILTAVIQGAHRDESSPEIQLAALQALFNSLEFVKANFEREGERNYIMQVVCEATQTANIDIKVAAYECLVRIMQLYYDKMHYYVEHALFGLTVISMRDPEQRVALQAIEFWSTICEEEIDLVLEAQEAAEYGEEPVRPCYHFARISAPQIMPVLMELLRQQDEDADEDEWDVSKAAGVCIGLLAQCVADDIVHLAIPFIEGNIRSTEWRERDAAVLCFGQILDGPDMRTLTPLVEQALPTIIEMMTDSNAAVKDSVAWTLGRITDLLIEVISLEVHLPPLVRAAIAGLGDRPHIAMLSGWILLNVTDQLGGSAALQPDGSPAQTSPISPFMPDIVSNLLAATDRPNNEHNARTSAYEALSTAMSGCAADCLPLASTTIVTMLDRQEHLNGVVSQLVGIDDRNNWSELQTNICSVIQAIIRRLGKEIAPLSDRIMNSLLTTIQNCGRQSEALEDAFMAVGSMIIALEADFEKYLSAFSPFLSEGLRRHEETQLCKTSVGLVGDICRALGSRANTYAGEFMNVLFGNLQSQTLSRDVKPTILSSFGDIALGIGAGFEPFLQTTMAVLQQAAASVGTQNPADYEMIDFIITLREGIAEAYVGIVGGLRGDNQIQLLKPFVEAIFTFLQSIATDAGAERTEPLLRSAVGLLGDLCNAFGSGELKPMLSAGWIPDLIKEARNRTFGQETRRTAAWAREQVKIASAGTGASDLAQGAPNSVSMPATA
ncbi:putative karyopherin beta-1 subunit [Meira miltonrushii]|uniref:Importin-95 n=1 Tax=Meira miltonrushii TaxID=1280837 RepID=A0A316VD87_9BASI|nr:putative karyopherin beta-1 subunit [Meira miltonrushii]PWN34213.1 putative karyopherin beta-1 subunit [Meira miltonrushii]